MRVVDHRWPWLALALLLFIGALATIHWLQHGFGQEFGFGFSLGLGIGIIVSLTAVGWRRGELQRTDHDQDARRLP